MSDSGGVLFVCMGNICRSPLAEAVARRQFAELGMHMPLGSAGTGDWHIGHQADARARATALRFQYPLEQHRAQQVCIEDFLRYDWILGMDKANLGHLRNMAPPQARARTGLLLEVAGLGEGLEVPDPYFGNDEGFVDVLRLIERGVAGFADRLRETR